ncbi:MAG TPA: O-antigen ligase family protein [Verrucomicrobiae bacterium]
MDFNRRNLDWWCERGILTLVLGLLVFAPLAFGAVYVWSFLVVQALVIGIALLWLVRLWGGYKPKLLWPPLAWAAVAFVIYAVIRYFTNDIEYVARQELIRVLLYVFLFLAVVTHLYSQDETEAVVYTLTLVAALAASYALAQWAHHSNYVWNLKSPYPARASGTYINPDHFAGFLELVLPLPLAFLLAGRVSVITRVLLTYAVLAIMGGLAVTFSRGGWLAAGAGLCLLLGCLMCHRNHRLRAGLVLVMLLLAGSIFTGFYLSKSVGYMRRVDKPDQAGPAVMDTRSRLQMWDSAVRMWRDHPLWGVGPGNFDYRFRQYRPEAFQARPQHAHNDYLELLADWGLAGAVIVFTGIGVFVFTIFRTWPHVRREENDFGSGMSSRYAFFLGGISGLFALMVHSLVDFNLHIPANVLAAVTVLGLVCSNVRFATKRYWVRARLPQQLIVTGAVTVIVVYFGYQGWHRAGEMVWTARAEHLPNYSTEQAAALEKALACEPKNFETAYNIGECFRVQSQDGGDNYRELATKALDFYALGIRNNPHDGDGQLRSGMCLDWLGRYAEAEPFYMAAEARDPNGNFVVANIGLHYVHIGDYPAARQWFLRANNLANWHNEIAKNYAIDICESKLQDRASGRLPIQFFYQGKGN